jgi:uncharacterized protein YjiK
MKPHFFSFLFSFVLLFTDCGNAKEPLTSLPGYQLKDPILKSVLPSILTEISGLTYLEGDLFACVQDENGILFIYNSKENKIEKEIPFHVDGDYEGIAKVNQSIYILRSDGVIFEIEDYKTDDLVTHEYLTGIPADNNEGLCFDPAENRLLVACKSKIGKGPEFKDKRVIYAFDLYTKKLSEEPVLEIDIQEIKSFALANKIDLPTREKKKGEEAIIRFRTSAICIHPITGHLYLLSAADHMLFVFDEKRELIHMELLDPRVFNKAEGVTFFENGDMLITNEGQEGSPTLLNFRFSE